MGVVKEQTEQTYMFNGNTVFPVILTVEVKRKLTKSEVDLARLVYKDSIPYDKVWIIKGGLLEMPNSSNNAMTPYGNIYLPSHHYDKIPDFTIDNKQSDNIRWFIHEMAHVWQYYAMDISVACRGIMLQLKGGYDSNAKAYAYDLLGADSKKEFKDFNIEQQAEIIAHYFWMKYYPATAKKYLSYLLISQQQNRKYILRDFLVNPKNKILKSINWGKNYR